MLLELFFFSWHFWFLDFQTWQELFLALPLLILAVFTKCKHMQKHCNKLRRSVVFSKTSKDVCFELDSKDGHTFMRREDIFLLSMMWFGPFQGPKVSFVL